MNVQPGDRVLLPINTSGAPVDARLQSVTVTPTGKLYEWRTATGQTAFTSGVPKGTRAFRGLLKDALAAFQSRLDDVLSGGARQLIVKARKTIDNDMKALKAATAEKMVTRSARFLLDPIGMNTIFRGADVGIYDGLKMRGAVAARGDLPRGPIENQGRALEIATARNLLRVGRDIAELEARGRIEGRSEESIATQLRSDWISSGPITGSLTRERPWIDVLSTPVGVTAQYAHTVASIADRDRSTLQAAAARINAELLEWVAIHEKTCKPCADRDGVQRTFADWLDIGLPRTSWGNPCARRCNCGLVLVGAEDALAVEESAA